VAADTEQVNQQPRVAGPLSALFREVQTGYAPEDWAPERPHLLCYPLEPDFRNSGSSRSSHMNTIVRVQHKGQMTIPSRVRSAVGLCDGDLVEVKAVGGRIVITPQVAIDRSKFSTADDEYTPEQRRVINTRLAKAEKGPFYGPFKSGVEIAAFLRKKQRSVKPAKSRKSG